MRVAIVGGGVIGCAVAERLARAGHEVVLLERDRVGIHASGAAAGLLAPVSEEQDEGAESLAMFPELAGRLERETGIGVEFHTMDSVTPAFDEGEAARLRRLAPRRWLDAVEVLRAEPALHPEVLGALVAAEAQVTPPRLVTALAHAAAGLGAAIREAEPVERLEVSGGEVTGLRVPGELVRADAYVLAAGPWSAALGAGAGLEIAVRPSRGQLVMLRPAPGQGLRRMITWQGRYLVPKPDGTVVAGSTEEAAGFDARTTAAGLAELLGFAQRAVPGLAQATVDRAWAALRPATPDGRPVIERAPGLANLVLATGHNRNGILLAPVTAERVGRLLA